MNLCLSLTHACNLRCRYCYAGAKGPRSMSAAVAARAVELAVDASSGSMQLGFFGGEPLLQWELLQQATEMTEAAAGERQITLRQTVTTNSTLLTTERVRWLADHGFFVALSIDGNAAMHDVTRPFADGRSSFEACLRGLALVRDHFPDFEVIVVPDPANVVHLADGVRFLAEEQAVPRVSVNPNFYTHWPEEALEVWRGAFTSMADFYLDRYRQHRPFALNFVDAKIITRLKNGFECRDRCNFGEREIAVAPSGRIYPCERLVGTDTDTTMCMGNVTDGFDEQKRQAILARRGNVDADCLDCGVRARCMNWCCCINYTLTGAIDRTDGIVCFHERHAIAAADRVAAQLYEERNPEFLARFYYDEESGDGRLGTDPVDVRFP